MATLPQTVWQHGALRFAGLQPPQRRVDTAMRDQFLVRAGLDHAARFQHMDRIGMAHGR